MGRLEPPGVAVALDPLHALVRAHVEPFRVVAEVRKQVVARDPAAVAARNAPAGQPRQQPRRVQVQTVVAAAPGRPRLGPRLEQERLDTGVAEQRGGGEAGRAGTDDRDFRRFHAGVLPSLRDELAVPGAAPPRTGDEASAAVRHTGARQCSV